MKHILVGLLLISYAYLLFSCGKDKSAELPSIPNDSTSMKSIIGTWDGITLYVTEYQNDQFIGGDTTLLSGPDFLTLVFKIDSTYSLSSDIQGSEQKDTGYYKQQTSQILLGAAPNDPNSEAYDYILNGDSLELSYTVQGTTNNIPYKDEEHIFFHRQ